MEKYLEECIESAIKQSLNDIEIICINDGSTDSSLEILKKYEFYIIFYFLKLSKCFINFFSESLSIL
mgnify:CR=1 FL=1